MRATARTSQGESRANVGNRRRERAGHEGGPTVTAGPRRERRERDGEALGFDEVHDGAVGRGRCSGTQGRVGRLKGRPRSAPVNIART
jgi:hypothetical protein